MTARKISFFFVIFALMILTGSIAVVADTTKTATPAPKPERQSVPKDSNNGNRASSVNTIDSSRNDQGADGQSGNSNDPKNGSGSANTDNALKSAGWLASLLSLIPYLGGVLMLAAAAIGALFYARRRKAYREWLEAELSGIRNRQKKMADEIDDVKKVTNVLNGYFQTQRSDIEKLDRAVSGQARMISQQPVYAAPQPVVPEYGSIPPSVVENKFPTSVEDYLAKHGQSAFPVAYDYKENLLISDPNGEGNLVVVRDGADHYLIPSLKLLSTKSLFDQYFERYYSCQNPRGGSIVVIEPALVLEEVGGWRLDKRGELEFR